MGCACRAPLRSGDRVRGTCTCCKATAARLVFEQALMKLPREAEEKEMVRMSSFNHESLSKIVVRQVDSTLLQDCTDLLLYRSVT